jgi:hypothetical protein
MQGSEEPETVDLDMRAKLQANSGGSGEAATRVLGEHRQLDEKPAEDPVAGWLAVVGGPGKGHIARISYGLNSIGRNAGQKIVVDFGDERISREKHALLSYDPANRSFHIQHGGGANLTYLNGEPLLTPARLESGDQIRLGDTLLRFIPLCSEDFDWEKT